MHHRPLRQHQSEIREVVIDNVTRMIACGSAGMGSRLYQCKNSACTYTKYLTPRCKSRACSSCGVKSTERLIRQQQHVLPDCEWKHITFTLLSTLWHIFRHNRWLLNQLFKCAADYSADLGESPRFRGWHFLRAPYLRS